MLQSNDTQLVGRGEVFTSIRHFVRKVARGSSPVLLLGEAGVGKELLAQTIHRASNRKSQPFLCVDCSLYYERELERELFGTVDPTGERKDSKGLLEYASKGTCYLSNVEELSPSLQERIRNLLETGYLQRVGCVKPVPSRVRLLFSSNKNLEVFAIGGLFSRALYDTLAANLFRLAPLREHPEDIQVFSTNLARWFEEQQPAVSQKIEFSDDFWGAVEAYPWPGNYDELKVELLRIFRVGCCRVGPEALSPEILHYWNGMRSAPEIRRVIEELESYIREFQLMAKLDVVYGEVLLDTDLWDFGFKEHPRIDDGP